MKITDYIVKIFIVYLFSIAMWAVLSHVLINAAIIMKKKKTFKFPQNS